LHIGSIVPPLELPGGKSALAGPYRRSTDKTGSAADRSPGTDVARGSADRRSQSGPHYRTDHRTAGSALIGGLTRGRPPDLLLCPSPAGRIVSLKYLEGLPRTGEHRNARARGKGCAPAKSGKNEE